MTARRGLFAAIILLGVGLVWFLWPQPKPGGSAPAIAPVEKSLRGTGGPAPTGPNAPQSPPAEVSDLARELNAPGRDIVADLRLVLEIVEAFRTNFPREGNPVGSNAEITAALIGSNRLRLALIAPNHPAINRGGELCDRWGTPFFFHSESASRMEIRSAGPDRKMWTQDDVVQTP